MYMYINSSQSHRFEWQSEFTLQEVEQLQHLEETTLSSDLAQGFALKSLTGQK
jgi:hypothetical protein